MAMATVQQKDVKFEGKNPFADYFWNSELLLPLALDSSLYEEDVHQRGWIMKRKQMQNARKENSKFF
jgi:hypothetical protein